MKIIYPDYNRCLVNLVNSILKHFEAPYTHNTLSELDNILDEYNYKNIVLILNDGLGSKILDRHLSKDSFLIQNKLADITSVFPATTVAATTSVLTGLNPNEHSWLGWHQYFKDINKTITTYLNTIKHTDIQAAPYNVAKHYIPYNSIIDIINDNNKYKAYGVSPYEYNRYNDENMDEMYSEIKKLCALDEKKFIYVYYKNPDYLMHEYGVNDKKVKANIEEINSKTEELFNSLENTLIIVTADHGLIDVKYKFLINYPTIKDTLIRETSIEPRATTYFVKDNKKDIFVKEFNKYFNKDFILLTKEEVLNNYLFGTGENHKKFQSCLGDFLSIAISNIAIKDNVEENPLVAMHAGVTEDEVIVPVILVKKGHN